MPIVGDSRRSDGAGPGFLPFQHHGFEKDGWDVSSRCGVVGMRIKGRLDRAGQFGEWVHEDSSVGDLTNNFLWANVEGKRPVPGWSFIWSATFAPTGRDGGSYGGLGTPTPAPIIGDTRTPSVTPTASDTKNDNLPDTDRKPSFADSLPGVLIKSPGSSIRYIPTASGPQIITYFTMKPGGGGVLVPGGFGGKGGLGQTQNFGGGIPGLNPGAPGLIVGSPLAPGTPGLVGGAFGLGLPPLQFNPYGGSIGKVPNVFGIGGGNLVPVFVIRRPNPKGNKQTENQVAAWYGKFEDQPTLEMLPLRDAVWTPDGRFQKLVPELPEAWPAMPYGFHGIAVAATNETEQIDYWHPTDPRLIAAHRGPADYGSIVADVAGKYINTAMQARLHSLTMVVRQPTGGRGVLKKNRDTQQNWLSWLIGPTGQYDAHGGLVTDFPPHATTAAKGSVIHGWASCIEGGPFSVGTNNDKHRLGQDADGNPINALHFSTMALFIRHGTGSRIDEDGPLLFGWEGYPEDIGTLEEPLEVYLDFDMRSGYWRWWTTTIFPTVPPIRKDYTTPDPRGTPTEPPGPPGEPEDPPSGEEEPGHGPRYDPDKHYLPPSAGGGTAIPPGGAPGGSGGAGGQGPAGPAPPGDPRAEPIRRRMLGPSPDRVTPGRIGKPRFFNAAYREVAFPSVAFRATLFRKGEPDLRHSETSSKEERRAQDNRNPIVLRLDTFAAQGNGAGDFRYTQKPSDAIYRGGTAPGSVLFTLPENRLGDDVFRLSGEAFIGAGPGVAFAAGSAHLPSGGIRDGYSWGTDGEYLSFYYHDDKAEKDLVFRLGPSGVVLEIVTVSADYTVEDGVGAVFVDSTGVTVTLPAASEHRGRRIRVKSAGGSGPNVTVNAVSGSIDNSASLSLKSYESTTCVSDGADWWTI